MPQTSSHRLRDVVLMASTFLALPAASLAGQAPALNTPSALPLDSASYGPDRIRVGLLMQVRADIPRENAEEVSTFFLRKAELGIRARVAPHTDLRFELDPVRPTDPFRRTYIRLRHLPMLHLKLGLEKAPIGLEELLSSARIPFVDRSEVSDRFAAAEEVGVHLDSRWTRWLLQLSLTNGGRRLLRDDNGHKDVSGRVVWAPRTWISLGAAMLRGRAGPEEFERNRTNAELKLGTYDSGLQAEFFDAVDGPVESSAFYIGAFHAIPLARSGISHVQPVVRYERVDRRDEIEEGELSLLTFGVSVLLDGHRSKFQANYLKDLSGRSDESVFRLQFQAEL